MHIQQAGLGLEPVRPKPSSSLVTLRPYQEEAISATLRSYENGLRRAMVVLATGLGKGLVHGTGVLTPDGYRPVESLVVGDQVIGRDGLPHGVTGVYPRGNLPLYEVMFNDGTSVRVDEDHLWDVCNFRSSKSRRGGNGKHWQTKSTRELVEEGVDTPYGNAKWSIPMVEPVQFPERSLPLDPYLLGLILGDGGISQGSVYFSSVDEWILDQVRSLVPDGVEVRHSDRCTYGLRGEKGRSNPLMVILRDLNLMGTNSHSKFIPESYLYGSVEQRWALLRGLMDTDGSARRDGINEFCSVSKDLADGVAFLTQSLGGVARRSIKTLPDGGVAYRVNIKLMDCPFAMPRKVDTWLPPTKYPPNRIIKSIEPAGFGEVTCIAVDAEDQLFVTEHCIVTHNTIISAALVDRMQQMGHGRVLFMAHREELIFQSVDKMKLVLGHDANVGIVKAEYNEPDKDIVVASVQTIMQDKRLARIQRAGKFGLVIVDEAHHASASSYRKILNGVGVFEDTGPLLFGMTATPDRTDGVGLNAVFEEIVYEMGIFDGIDQGYLVDIVAKEVLLDADFSKIKTTAGEYQAGDSGRVLMQSQAPEVIAQAIRDHAMDRQSIVFTPTVEVAHATAEALEAVGVRSAALDASTPADERKRVIEGVHAGAIQAVANVGIMTEGTDLPPVSCIVMAQPTKSRLRYTQMVGRGLRTHMGKEDCLILDLVGATGQHKLQTVASLFGVPPKALKERSVREELIRQREEREKAPAGTVVVRDVDMSARRSMHWIMTANGQYVLSAPPGQIILRFGGMMSDGGAGWDVWYVDERKKLEKKASGLPLDYAQGVAEDLARQDGVNRGPLVDPDAPWRSHPVTEAQLRRCKWLGIPTERLRTKGEASDAMNAAEAMMTLNRIEKEKQGGQRLWAK